MNKEDIPLEKTAKTNAQWHLKKKWYIQGNTFSWDGSSAGYLREDQGLQQLKLKDYIIDGKLLKNFVKKIM